MSCCDTIICEGCLALLEIDERRRFVFRVRRGGTTGSDRGVLRHDDIIGLPYGSVVRLSTGVKAYVLKPLLVDLMERFFARRSQVIYPKDQGLILLMAGITPGARVVEVGVGSGFTTAVLASMVGPEGHVYCYEVRADMLETARRNLEAAGLLDRVTLKLRDAREGIEERDVDAVVADIPEPWSILDHVHRALKPSGVYVAFMPSVNQVIKLLRALEEKGYRGFTRPRVLEVLVREYQARSDAFRPKTTMVAHTGYIAFMRKLVEETT